MLVKIQSMQVFRPALTLFLLSLCTAASIQGQSQSLNNLVPVQDTYVSQNNGNSNFGSNSFGWLGDIAGANALYLQYNLSSIPPNSIIVSASLSFQKRTTDHSGDMVVQLRKRRASWNSSTVTWNGSGPLQDPIFGSGSLNTSLSFPVLSGDALKAMVTEWVQDPSSNHGITILPGVLDGTSISFYMKENTLGGNPIRLSVTYQPCSVPGTFSLNSPASGQQFPSNTLSTTLSWGASFGATSYDVYFGTSSNPPFLENVTTTSRGVGVDPGQTYYWRVVAKNACGERSSPIAFFSVAPELADLDVSLISINPSQPQVGDVITISGVIRNIGATTSPPFDWSLSLNANLLDSGRPAFLAPGGSLTEASISWSGSLPKGIYRVDLLADTHDEVQESEEENNSRTASFEVTPRFGTTIITHGYQFNEQMPCWTFSMAQAIRRRAGRGRILLYDAVSGAFEGCQVPVGCELLDACVSDVDGEDILIFDWAQHSDDGFHGYSEAAGDALFVSLVERQKNNELRVPLHFIGHSRGTVVNSEAVERLLAVGFQVDHVTMLDPVDNGFLGPFRIVDDLDVNAQHDGRRGVVAWSGIGKIEDYFSRELASCWPQPKGQAVDGVVLLDLTERNLCHSDVHAFYHFTVDLEAVTDGDGINFEPDWFGTASPFCGEVAPREFEGYYYSRIVGGALQCPETGNRTPVSFNFGWTEGIINGDFERGSGNEIPGWSLHGGGGTGARLADTLGDDHLVLTRDWAYRRHNRFYIPPDAQSIRYCMLVHTADPSGVLEVRIGGDLIRSDPVIAQTLDCRVFRIGLTGYRDSVQTLEFRLIPGTATPEVWIDDIQLELAGASSTPEAPVPLSPSDGAVLETTTPTLIWSAYEPGADGDSQVGYQIRVWSDDGASQIVYDSGFISEIAASSHTYTPGTYTGTDPITGTTRVSEPLAPGRSYQWQVRFRDSGGSWSSWSDNGLRGEQGFSIAGTPPAAPTWLRATPSSSASIDLLWDDNANNEDGFKVERKVGPAGAWTVIATLPANATTYQDLGLTCGTTYAYRVWAFNSAGSSGMTNEASATPECSCTESTSPESQSFDALGGTGNFNVTACGPWTAVSGAGWITVISGASGSGNGTVSFRVDRNNVQSSRTGTISLPELGLTFTVEQTAAPADPGFTSFLRLVSGTVAGQTVDPDHRTVTVQAGAAVSGSLTFRIDSSFGSNAVMAMGITPSWGDHATSYTSLGGFSTPSSGLLRNATINYTAPSTPGTYHVIAAYRGEFNAGQVMSATNWGVGTLVWNNGDDIAGWSAGLIATANRDGNVLANYLYNVNIPTWVPATAITIVVEAPAPQPPVAPTWLRATPSSPTSIDLQWDDNANNEDGFKVERKVGPAGPWTVIDTLPANATTSQDTGLTCGTTYAYRVWAFNSAGNSGTTNEAGATPECPCNESLTPESVSFDALGGTGSFNVTACGPWTGVSDAGWITITSGTSGSGNGTVDFRVDRSNVQSARTGTITLPELGLSFTVQQAAAPADPGFTSFLRLVSGTVAGQTVDPDHRTVTVQAGSAISGSLTLRIDSSFPSNAVMAIGVTPSWGDHATSYTDLGHFSTPASGLLRNATINSTAPSIPGTYHVIAAYRGEFNAGQVMSATNWGVGTLIWNNGDDVAGWSAGLIATANRDGNVLADYLHNVNIPTWVPATAITIVVEAPTPQPPAAPSWLRTTPASPTIIDLLWDDNANNEDGFRIERKVGPAGPWTIIATLPANATNYQDTGLTCGTTYAYRVWAFSSAGDSGTTNEAGATPECAPQSGVLLSDDFEDGASAGWQTWVAGWSESGGAYHGTETGADLRNETVWSGGSDWSDYTAEVDLVLLGTHGPADGQLLLRYNSETDRIACRLFQLGSSQELQLLVPGQPMLSVPFGYLTGQVYRLRASVVQDSATCEVVGHPATRLVQTSLGSRTGTVGMRNTHIAVSFDNLEVRREADRTFSDSFESGDPSGFTSHTGSVTVRPGLAGAGGQARYLGEHGLEVDLSNPSPSFVQASLPGREASYRARFAINLRSLSQAEGEELDLFAGYDGADPVSPTASGDLLFRLAVRQLGGARWLTGFARLDSGTEVEIPSALPLADGWRIVEIHWTKSSGAGSGDGTLDFWVDGVPGTGLKDLDNDLQGVRFIRWGAVSGSVPQTSGSFELDDFDSRRADPIGPLPVFTDVPVSSTFWPPVQGLYAAELTSGCAIRRYCPDLNVTRAEMAVFLVRATRGSDFVPPPASGIFSDVPVEHWASPFVEQLYADGITRGCATQPLQFCPNAAVNRAEMAVFLLRARHGRLYTPPPATGTVFSDVSAGYWAAPWIEQLHAEGITAGCGGGSYCPTSPVTRWQMAFFLVRTFGLPVQQPAP